MDVKVLHEKVKAIWDDKWKNNFIGSDVVDGVLDVTLPPSYSDVTDVITAPKGHTVMTMEQIEEYFKEIDKSRVESLNGKMTGSDTSYQCDFCNVAHIDHGESYWYCNECNKDMCTLCKDEDSAEKAASNKAKRWLERKDALEACRKHGLNERKVPDNEYTGYTCNLCRASVHPEWFENRDEEYDVCMPCSVTTEGLAKINELKMTKQSRGPPCSDAMFGSMLDWIPLIESKDHDTVLQNRNPASPWHLKYALMAMDDHGRCGYSTLWKPVTLAEILQEIEVNNKRKVKEGKTGESTDDDSEFEYDSAIKKMMQKRHMRTHFG
jgi:hypothetical protein